MLALLLLALVPAHQPPPTCPAAEAHRVDSTSVIRGFDLASNQWKYSLVDKWVELATFTSQRGDSGWVFARLGAHLADRPAPQLHEDAFDQRGPITGAYRQDVVVEGVAGAVQPDAVDNGAVADPEVAAWPRRQHEREVLASHAGHNVALHLLVAHD